jgi:hypothetical protein
MSLRVLDLRGTHPPFDHLLPRPVDPGADVHGAVAEVVRRVREEGDRAVVEFTGKFDGVDVSEEAGGVRVAPAEITARVRDLRHALSWPTSASWPTTPTRAPRRARSSRAG